MNGAQIVSTTQLGEGTEHDRVWVWNRGAMAGTLTVQAGDGRAIVAALDQLRLFPMVPGTCACSWSPDMPSGAVRGQLGTTVPYLKACLLHKVWAMHVGHEGWKLLEECLRVILDTSEGVGGELVAHQDLIGRVRAHINREEKT